VRDILEALQKAASPADNTSAEEKDQLLNELKALLASPKCRLCLRQAGGIALLVKMLPARPVEAAGLLLQVCMERRAQLEFYESGGTTAVLRYLKLSILPEQEGRQGPNEMRSPATQVAGPRRIQIEEVGSDDEELSGEAQPGPARPFVGAPVGVMPHGAKAVAAQLSLLATACRHARVLEAVQRAAASEDSYNRLVCLLGVESPPIGEARAQLDETHAAAANILGQLACGGKSKALLGLAPSLSKAVVGRMASPTAPIDVRFACATAIGNLSTSAAFRTELIKAGATTSLLVLVRHVGAHAGKPQGLGVAEALLPNTLAGLNNLSLIADGMATISVPEMGPLLVPWLVEPSASRLLLRRVLAVLAKGANRCSEIVTHILGEKKVVVVLTKLVEAELARSETPSQMDPSAKSRGNEQDCGGTEVASDEASDETDAEILENGGGGGLLGDCVRILTSCARNPAGPPAMCDTGALPLLAKVLRTPGHSSSHGNAALAIAECANEPRCLTVLAVQPLVPPLLDMAHRGEGQAMKNAAIALARLAKNEHCLKAIRDGHGIEILARAMKGDVAKTMAGR